MPRTTTTTYRTNADGSAVCPHRDLSCCPACVLATDELVEVAGAHFHVPDADDRRALLLALEADDLAPEVGDCRHCGGDDDLALCPARGADLPCSIIR